MNEQPIKCILLAEKKNVLVKRIGAFTECEEGHSEERGRECASRCRCSNADLEGLSQIASPITHFI